MLDINELLKDFKTSLDNSDEAYIRTLAENALWDTRETRRDEYERPPESNECSVFFTENNIFIWDNYDEVRIPKKVFSKMIYNYRHIWSNLTRYFTDDNQICFLLRRYADSMMLRAERTYRRWTEIILIPLKDWDWLVERYEKENGNV